MLDAQIADLWILRISMAITIIVTITVTTTPATWYLSTTMTVEVAERLKLLETAVDVCDSNASITNVSMLEFFAVQPVRPIRIVGLSIVHSSQRHACGRSG